MEIPNALKFLYKHWESHTKYKFNRNSKVDLDRNTLNNIKKFAIERQSIWEKQTKGHEPPLTKDIVFQSYRFCNIYRELDRQTIEIHKLLKESEQDFDLWLLNVMFCRLVCNTDTINKIGLLSYNSANNEKVYRNLLNLPNPKFGSAYIFPVSLIMKSPYPTREKFFCLYLPEVMKQCGKTIKCFKNIGVVDALNDLLPIFRFNLKFHWTEVLIDVAYQFPNLINLYGRFPIGPGAKPTMKVLSDTTDPETTCLTLAQTLIKGFPYLTYKNEPVMLSSENWEGIGCEFRKYSNLKKGKGRRRLYR